MDEFDYPLPAEAIAQHPVEPRSSARLLVGLDPFSPAHRTVADLPSLVGQGDLLVVNDTKVLPARLRLHKPTGGAVEVLLLEDRGAGVWEALIRPSKKVPAGLHLFNRDVPVVEAGEHLDGGRRLVQLLADPADHGRVALPPYINAELDDDERYQTVYANRPGSVAAPTAGLHLTDAVLDACRDRGAKTATVDLAVGLDTFRPVTADHFDDHVMHSERYEVSEATLEACKGATRVIAVGTTTVRALESAARSDQHGGRTDLF
ncbi:MAG: S-adenosylmethionine:tRNA ribosyltransferase-isomerase, partial [Acidimicrobiales bacterium]